MYLLPVSQSRCNQGDWVPPVPVDQRAGVKPGAGSGSGAGAGSGSGAGSGAGAGAGSGAPPPRQMSLLLNY